jgi:hypothetical protein
VNSCTRYLTQESDLDLHIIRYEDLLSKPSEQLPKLASLLGVLAEANEIARVIGGHLCRPDAHKRTKRNARP